MKPLASIHEGGCTSPTRKGMLGEDSPREGAHRVSRPVRSRSLWVIALVTIALVAFAILQRW